MLLRTTVAWVCCKRGARVVVERRETLSLPSVLVLLSEGGLASVVFGGRVAQGARGCLLRYGLIGSHRALVPSVVSPVAA